MLLDTNVISGLMAPTPHARLVDWLNARNPAMMYLSVVTLAEIGYGLRILPPGKRRSQLEARFKGFVERGFAHRILDFDQAAAHLYGEVMGHRRELGRPLATLDGQIAAIARANDLALATRNVRDFVDCGVEVVNPFSES